jgi:hypothetical protein
MPGRPPPSVKPPQPLPENLRARMETAFGADFSSVRLHVSSNAAMQLGARSFTQGEDIHFAPGQEHRLLGHELTHVVQQRSGRVAPGGLLPGEGDRLVTNGQLAGDAPISSEPSPGGERGGAAQP